MHREGAEIAITYQNERFKDRIEKLGSEFDAKHVLPCDVGSDQEIAGLFAELHKHWDGLDVIVHAIGFAPAEQLDGDYVEAVNREGFKIAHDIAVTALLLWLRLAKL